MEECQETICTHCGGVNACEAEICRSCGNLLHTAPPRRAAAEDDEDPGEKTVMVFARNPGPRRFQLIQIDENGEELDRFDIQDGSVIGRTTGDIQLQDRHVSRRHCSFSLHNERLQLKDLNSTNGVYLRVRRSARVRIPAELMIGHTICRVVSKT